MGPPKLRPLTTEAGLVKTTSTVISSKAVVEHDLVEITHVDDRGGRGAGSRAPLLAALRGLDMLAHQRGAARYGRAWEWWCSSGSSVELNSDQGTGPPRYSDPGSPLARFGWWRQPRGDVDAMNLTHAASVIAVSGICRWFAQCCPLRHTSRLEVMHRRTRIEACSNHHSLTITLDTL
jgi:hypothetical protein